MKFRQFAASLTAALIVGGCLASSAFAAPSTVESHWKVEGSTITSKEIKCHGNGTFVLQSTLAGLPLRFTATGVDCLSGSVISQNGNMAEDAGKLKFTGVTVDEPAGCSVLNGSVETEQLNTRLEEEGPTVYDRFEPATGETGNFFTIRLRKCSFEGNYSMTGYFYGRSPNAIGVEESGQTLELDAATDAISSIRWGGNAAILHAEIVTELVNGSVVGATK